MTLAPHQPDNNRAFLPGDRFRHVSKTNGKIRRYVFKRWTAYGKAEFQRESGTTFSTWWTTIADAMNYSGWELETKGEVNAQV